MLCCIDRRFIQAVQREIRGRAGVRDYYLRADGGGVKALVRGAAPVRAWALRVIRVAYAQGARRVIMIQHEDCLAYGGSGAFRSAAEERAWHIREVQAAAAHLQRRLPGIRVQGWYARGEGAGVLMRRVPLPPRAGSRS
ncbi:MAG TPA: hypothetical protein VGB20_03265 [bacterium]